MMRLGHRSFGYVLVLGGMAASCSPGDGAAPATCLGSVYAEYTASQRAWQESLRDIVVSERPEFAELAGISRQLQLAMIDMAEARFHYVSSSPERLEAQPGISEFANLGVVWSDADEAALVREAPAYREVARRTDSLRAINKAHPDWPLLRAYATEDLVGTPEFTGALDRFQRRLQEIDAKLGACAEE